MKSSKEFFERLSSDEKFANEIAEKAQKKADEGEQDYIALWQSLAAEYDYELTKEELEESKSKASEELSNEELGKVAGGTTPILVFSGMSIIIGTSVATIIKDAVDD